MSGRAPPCIFFAKGSCKQGAMCQFSHDPSDQAVTPPLCRNFNSPMGCRFAENCAFLHNERCPAGDPTAPGGYGPGPRGRGDKRGGGRYGGPYGGPRGGPMGGGPGPFGQPGPYGMPQGGPGGYGGPQGGPHQGYGMMGQNGYGAGPQAAGQAQAALSAGASAKPQVPPGWTAQFDNNTQMWYYINNATLATQWEVPTEPVYVNQNGASAPGGGGATGQPGGAQPAAAGQDPSQAQVQSYTTQQPVTTR